MKHVIQTSGGVTSWAAGRRIRDEHPDAEMVALFCDVGDGNPLNGEDPWQDPTGRGDALVCTRCAATRRPFPASFYETEGDWGTPDEPSATYVKASPGTVTISRADAEQLCVLQLDGGDRPKVTAASRIAAERVRAALAQRVTGAHEQEDGDEGPPDDLCGLCGMRSAVPPLTACSRCA